MMIILRAGLFFLSLATACAQTLNTSREFHLHTQLKPGQDGKARFDNLWLYAYHTGAGMNDAMLSANKSYAIPGFLNGTNLEFDLGTQGIPWSMYPDISVNLYAAWEPVRINGGVGSNQFSSFSMNATGLQWSDASSGGAAEGFGGWLVCEWWHPDVDSPTSGPQLFFRVNGYSRFTIETCADVNLIPEYL